MMGVVEDRRLEGVVAPGKYRVMAVSTYSCVGTVHTIYVKDGVSEIQGLKVDPAFEGHQIIVDGFSQEKIALCRFFIVIGYGNQDHCFLSNSFCLESKIFLRFAWSRRPSSVSIIAR